MNLDNSCNTTRTVAPSTGIDTSPKSIKNFWKWVTKGENCWEWTGCKNFRGYGRFTRYGKQFLAHRMSYVIHFGDFDDFLFVCHRCDNPGCVRPEHLFLGTHQDNVDDMIFKGRWGGPMLLGNSNPAAKLNPEKVREIRKLHSEGVATRAITRMFKIDRKAIQNVIRRITWAHVN